MAGSTVLARLGDYHSEWHQLRGRGGTLVTADDTPLDLAATGATNDWDNKPAEPALFPQNDSTDDTNVFNCVPAVAVNVPKMTGGRLRMVEIIGYGTNAADENCAWILYAYRGRYSPAIRIAAGTAILGTYPCSTDPVSNEAITTGFYVDTWGTTSDYWDDVTELDNADNTCSRMIFDLRGYAYMYLELLPTSGTCASFGAAYSGV